MTAKKQQFDVVIIGGAAAGLTAAIYTVRRGLKTLIISKDLGGQSAITASVENYPGVDLCHGLDLMKKIKEQAEGFGAEFVYDEVTALKQKKMDWQLTTTLGEYQAQAVILAFGLTPNNLEAPGEKELIGRGVSYSPTDHADNYKGKTVVVVGGGNSAMESAELLSHIAKKIYIVHRRDQFRAEAITMKKVEAAKNIEWLKNAQVKEILGRKHVEGVKVEFNDGEIKKLKCDGVFIHIGYGAKTDWLNDYVELSDRNEIIVNMNNETKTPGLFAAGDVTQLGHKQIVISAGEGAKAALQCYKYLQKKTGGQFPAGPDWGLHKS